METGWWLPWPSTGTSPAEHTALDAELLRATDLADSTGVPLRHTDSLPAGDATSHVSAVDGLDRAALRLYTSGTTGEPKRHRHHHRQPAHRPRCPRYAFGWDGTTRVYTVLPVHHANALVISSLLPWLTGSSTVLTDRFRTDTFWADVTAEQATTASLVPTLLEFLLAAQGQAPPCFAEVLCGAGPLLAATAVNFETISGYP